MIYLIENQIVFNPEDNSLSLLSDTESKITVSNPARRILSLLIEQHGSVVQRELFFKKVWDDYGLISSNNNLNHCISKLRKVISTLGYPDEFIVTVPKVGFIIRKEIYISLQFGENTVGENPPVLHEETITVTKTFPADFSEGLSSPTISEEAAEPEQQKVSLLATRKINYKYPFIFSAFFLFSFVFWGVSILHGVMTDPKARLYIANIGTCELYSTAPVSLSKKEDFIHLAQDFILTHQISCTPGNIFIFQSEQFITPINTGSIREFLAQCSINDNHQINICISYYANDRTTHDKY